MYKFYGNDFKVQCPTGSGNYMTLYEIAYEISQRLVRIFKQDENGKRPLFGENAMFQDDPNWNNHILFYEYFNGDTGKGLGASHQTGWTGLVTNLIEFFYRKNADLILGDNNDV
jgi:hypothetical protein